jgi:hypothetical protein
MMKPQGTIKLLTGGMRIGLALLVAGVASGSGQTSPAQPNDVRKALNQAAQADPKTPATAKPAQSSSAAPQSQVRTPSPAATAKATGNPAGLHSQVKTAAPAATAKATANSAAASTAKTAQGNPAALQPPAKTAAQGATAKATGNPAGPSTAKPAPAAARNPTAPELKTVAEHSTVARRDPFNPLLSQEKGTTGPQTPLPAGKPGLVITSLRVDGIVRGPGGMIAVVSNPQMRVYFLREGDRLYDGDVAHITMEGVSFHETGRDAFGKPVERESTKRLYPTPGEQQ